MLPRKLQKKLDDRNANNAFRSLGKGTDLVDFASNDYLGFSSSEMIFNRASEILKRHQLEINGATGSRLLSGNHALFQLAEHQIAQFHSTESALIFNSGYDANIGFFSSVPQRGDVIFYDELCHASIRDGIQMSHANANKFKHNNVAQLEKKLESFSLPLGEMPKGQRGSKQDQIIYIVTESIFSMDGDQPDLKAMVEISKKHNCHLVVDEAHSIGVFGEHGEGLVQQLGLENSVFARVVTFGKALGCHGAAILGSVEVKDYLINFARSFIYTTGLPPHSLATISAVYEVLENTPNRASLKKNIALLRKYVSEFELTDYFIESQSAVHSCIIPGNDQVKKISAELRDEGFDVKPILSPTVPKGKERLRICVHSYNSETEIKKLIQQIKNHIKILSMTREGNSL